MKKYTSYIWYIILIYFRAPLYISSWGLEFLETALPSLWLLPMQYLHALHCRITITQRCLPVCLWSEWECRIQVGLWQYCAHGSCTRMPSPQLIRKWHHSQAKILAWYFNQPAWLASRNNKRLKAKSKSCPTTFGSCSQHTPQLKYSTLTKKYF